MDIPGVEMKLRNLLASPAGRYSETGAITIVETLIVLSIGLIALTIWAQAKLSEYQNSNAANAGRAVAAYSRAASVWLAENPPGRRWHYLPSAICRTARIQPAFATCRAHSALRRRSPMRETMPDEPVNYGNLDIDVVITPEGATGVIDFGVFRAGDDENEDGLPDSRPDLASIAFQTAAEESGAGVLEFFEMRFARESPLGLEFDPDEASFDQAAIDDLSRLQARVGALVGDAPFLRLDGANEMSAGINFDNGMQVNMDGVGLAFQGPGDVGVSTTTGTLVVTQNIQTATLQSDSAVIDALQSDSASIDELTVDPLTGVKGGGFERLNQAPDVVRIDDDVIRLTSRVQVNETDIESNRQNIADNETDINRLTGEVNDNETDINANRRSISSNDNDIARNRRSITSQGNAISALQNTAPPPPPPPPPPICSPTLSAATPSTHPYGPTSCGTTCYLNSTACPANWRCSGSSTTASYQDRDPHTLNCRTHTATFYAGQCRPNYTGNPCK